MTSPAGGRPQRDGVLLTLQNCPTGKSVQKSVQPFAQKYSAFAVGQIKTTIVAIPRPQEGRFAIVTDVGCGERWTR